MHLLTKYFIYEKIIFTNYEYTNNIKFIFTNSIHSIKFDNQNFIKNLSGPRIGFTIITNGDLKDELVSEFGLTSNIITQFGYQFEKQIMGDENVAGLVEGIIFLGGLEHGLFLPSLSGMFGARFSSGYEFAVGPNLSLEELD